MWDLKQKRHEAVWQSRINSSPLERTPQEKFSGRIASDATQHFSQVLGIPTSVESLREIVAELCNELGFDSFILQARGSRFEPTDIGVYASNTSIDWRELRNSFGLTAACDPVLRALMNQASPVLWRDALKNHSELFRLARSHGMNTGISHVTRGRGGAWTQVSYISSSDSRDAESAILAVAPVTQLLTCRIHDAVTRISTIRAHAYGASANASSALHSLTLRERECLALAATGRTADGISRVLGISASTVTEHLKLARHKLGASNLPHAVALAIANGYLLALGSRPE